VSELVKSGPEAEHGAKTDPRFEVVFETNFAGKDTALSRLRSGASSVAGHTGRLLGDGYALAARSVLLVLERLQDGNAETRFERRAKSGTSEKGPVRTPPSPPSSLPST
jgi:hypothetical protein